MTPSGAPADLLRRAAPLIRLPAAPDDVPEVGGVGLRSRSTGVEFAYRDGILDLLPADGPKTLSQWSLDTAITAWLYDRARTNEALLRLAGLPDFETEVREVLGRLGAQPGDTVVDLACGHGNFTMEWARVVGASGLVIGLDLSRSMLARAADRVAAARAANVLLIHGDAQHLPIASRSVRRVNCSGGFHAFPDLPGALAEIARISVPGAVLTASMFAENPERPRPRLRELLRARLGLHLVPLPRLGERLRAVGYSDYAWSVRRGMGHVSAAFR